MHNVTKIKKHYLMTKLWAILSTSKKKDVINYFGTVSATIIEITNLTAQLLITVTYCKALFCNDRLLFNKLQAKQRKYTQ